MGNDLARHTWIMGIAVLLILGCQPNNGVGARNSLHQKLAHVASIPIDASTPDRALKSYWQIKDAVRKLEFEWDIDRYSEFYKAKNSAGFNARKLMTSGVLSDSLRDKAKYREFEQYEREIIDLKQDSESRATVFAKIRNSTPIPEGAVVSDSDKKRRLEGARFKYILEKEQGGWKVSQVYIFDEFRTRFEGKEPWKAVFSSPSQQRSISTWVHGFDN